ncbi:hypothetical protein GBAR_LOCUS29700, partial [Geodia barretti]
MSVAADVSDWIATPAPLNSNKCGKNAVFSSDNSVVQRRDPWYEECVCYTVHPLPPGLVWQTTVLETTTKWSRGLQEQETGTWPFIFRPGLRAGAMLHCPEIHHRARAGAARVQATPHRDPVIGSRTGTQE